MRIADLRGNTMGHLERATFSRCGSRRPLRAAVSLLALASAVAACSEGPTGPRDGPSVELLAGGGRASHGDAFVGGLGDSGPTTPDERPGAPDIYPYFPVAFYSDTNCFGEPFERVIDSQVAWEEWLELASSCAGEVLAPRPDGSAGAAPYEPDQPSPLDHPTEPVDPVEPPGGGWGEPFPDFETSVVAVIGVEEEAGWGRHLQVAEVSTTGTLTHVRFEVLAPAEDCWAVLMGPFDPAQVTTAPVAAVVVPRPLGEILAFERTDTVWRCIVEPDPEVPLTLYYTDGSCELGGDERVIRDAEAWNMWLGTATECDFARRGSGVEPVLPEGMDGGGSAEPGLPVDMPAGWLSPSVDFSSHAVLVLGAPEQRRWGGGVWLSGIEQREGGGTALDYWIMTPGPDCPAVERGATLRPTAAIRVPLPLAEPVTFSRNTETVECRWEPMSLRHLEMSDRILQYIGGSGPQESGTAVGARVRRPTGEPVTPRNGASTRWLSFWSLTTTPTCASCSGRS